MTFYVDNANKNYKKNLRFRLLQGVRGGEALITQFSKGPYRIDTFEINTLPEHYTQGENFVLGPFTYKSK